MSNNIIYKDNLVEISNDFILVKNYYFPLIGSKRVAFNKIDSIRAEEPSLMNGRFRIWGTGNFTTWFPLDLARPKRDKIFTISIHGKTVNVGFTVKDSETVVRIFGQKGLIKHATA